MNEPNELDAEVERQEKLVNAIAKAVHQSMSEIEKDLAAKDLEDYMKKPRWQRAIFLAWPRGARIVTRFIWLFS